MTTGNGRETTNGNGSGYIIFKDPKTVLTVITLVSMVGGAGFWVGQQERILGGHIDTQDDDIKALESRMDDLDSDLDGLDDTVNDLSRQLLTLEHQIEIIQARQNNPVEDENTDE